MSHYSDCYYEERKHEFEREARANNFRERLTVEIKGKDVIDVIIIGEKYLKDENLG